MLILEKQILAEALGTKITKLVIKSPEITKGAKPGQFVALMVNEKGERFPLTIVDKDEEKGTITIIVQELGLSTRLLGRLNKGDKLYSLVGPLGHVTPIKKYGKVILIGGGVGIAEIYPVAKMLRKENNHITTILGTRTKELLILEKELKQVSHDFFITTDDGSSGKKGFVTDVLRELISKEKYDLVYAVGPIPMMNKVAETTRGLSIKTIVSLNALMVDATGMCGSCRVTVGDETKFACVDGPEFDAHLINWDEFIKRNRIYEEKEKYICKLNKLA